MYVFVFMCVGIVCRWACVCICVYVFMCVDRYMCRWVHVCVHVCMLVCVCGSVVDVGCFLQLLSSFLVVFKYFTFIHVYVRMCSVCMHMEVSGEAGRGHQLSLS